MQKLSELLNIKLTENNPLKIYHPIFKDKIIYWETNENWYKMEYDNNEETTYFENNSGYWYKIEHDSNGIITYFENSDGTIEDNRVTELTLDQIAEKFGISVNQLKIKNKSLVFKVIQIIIRSLIYWEFKKNN